MTPANINLETLVPPRDGAVKTARIALAAAGLGAALIWCFWPVLRDMARDWQRDQDDSVGFLVPLIAGSLIWRSRYRYWAARSAPCAWGALLLFGAFVQCLLGRLYFLESVERYAVVVAVAGTVLWIAGARVMWQMRWVLAFLLLMVPLPGRIHNLVSPPLQDLATAGAVAALELTGVAVAREGCVILLLENDISLGVDEACNGLRMLMAFVVVSATFAALVDRPLWLRAVMVASSIPIAIVCNTARLVITAVCLLFVDSHFVETYLHDLAGLSMMPAAVVLLMIELKVLDRTLESSRSRKTVVPTPLRALGTRH